MKPIPSTFRKNGWNYKLLARNEHAAIYTQSLHQDLPANGRAAGYEVVVIGRREAGSATLGGVVVEFEASETLPATESWGVKGWTFPTKEAAEVKFAEISAKISHCEAGNAVVANE
jgi:hypothetical protein